ncbi:ImmA/IrrE family metallo-endopeptidase [Bacillus gobiensis]|uniref:ImmA/IrrE family metallo-endopeptidase n=1 Tax=Bacillus gobiensis TaxID=1441095 RepID=UPI003D2494B8
MNDIKGLVNYLTRKHRSNNPFDIAQSLSIIVLFEDLGKLYGYYNYQKRFKFIHINNKLSELERIFVCAHELGHSVLHPRSNTSFMRQNTYFSLDKMEVEANMFAVELLLPDEKILNFNNTQFSVEELCEIHGIPRELANLKKF